MLGEDVPPVDMLQGRSPRLDLDSLYGNGPGDPGPRSSTRPTGCTCKTGTTIADVRPAPRPGTTCRASARGTQQAKRSR